MQTPPLTTPDQALALDTYVKLARAAASAGTYINLYLRDHDLTDSQFGVLEALYHLGPLPTGQLGEKILKSSGNMTLVIDNLVRRGLVERRRHVSDRRCIEIHLTQPGCELIAALWPEHADRVTAAFTALSPSEQCLLGELCKRLGRAAQLNLENQPDLNVASGQTQE